MKTDAPLPSLSRSRAGFSLVELTIVVVILGVLAMMGVPRYQTVVERAKASESYSYLAHVAKAQEMYRARTGVYADSLQKLSINAPSPQHFSVGQPTSIDWQTRWSLRLTREGASSGFGAYTVSFSEQGFDAARSSIPTALSPTGEGGGQEVSSSTSGGSGGSSSSSGGSSNGSSSGSPSGGSSNGGPQGNNGVGNGNGGGRDGNRGRGGGGPQGNNGVGNGNGGGRDGNRGGGGPR